MILLVSNSRDFATDYIVAELRRRDVPYSRLDWDLIHKDLVELDPLQPSLRVSGADYVCEINSHTLRSILFRGPTHLRESSGGRYEPIEALQRHQWAAFLRSLMVFREAKWMNHPAATYLAENKPYQLATASKLGFHVPHSRIANHVPPNVAPESRSVAVKALDSFLLRLADTDAFFYTQIVEREELCRGDLQSMPLIIQSPLEPKIDLRVTVVGSEVFAVAVTKNGRGIRGDWRLHKEKAEFPPHELPSEVCAKCRNLVEALGLAFGAIDLALVNGEYYFIEINPTGEWAWLCDSKVPIDRAVVDWLAG